MLFALFLHKSYIWENIALEIESKMVSASQIPGFLNQPFLQHKSMKQHNYLHVNINSQKFKADQNFLVMHGQKSA